MTDHKFTDEEIIDGLICLSGEIVLCQSCAFSRLEDRGFACKKNVSNAALSIIKRQKAEIESLKKLLDGKCDRCIARDRAEAVTEFAERLKGQCSDETTDNTNNPCVSVLYDAKEAIDDLVKEMMEENEKT